MRRSHVWDRLPLMLAADSKAGFVTPLADALVADVEDGFVGPLCWCGGRRGGVGVVGSGVLSKGGEAFAIPAIDQNLDHVEKGAVTLPAPADDDETAADFELDERLQDGEIGTAVHFTLNAERLADGDVIGGLCLDLLYQGAEAHLDPQSHGGNDGGKSGLCRGSRSGRRAAVTDKILPRGPLLAAIVANLLAGQGVGKVVSIRRLGSDLGGADAHEGGVGTNVQLKGTELGRELRIPILDVVRLRHMRFAFGFRNGGLGGGIWVDVARVARLENA